MQRFLKNKLIEKNITRPLLCALLVIAPYTAQAFCGFYVAKADATLFNKASQVVLVRNADRTVITMANDYQGEMKEFAMVIPVPTFLKRSQIHVADKALIDHLDAYTAPRLVEYFDANPCQTVYLDRLDFAAAPRDVDDSGFRIRYHRAKKLGVKIEASYTVGEYDILILSAKQSDGLETWLTENGYRIPKGARSVLGSYIKQGMRFFVAKVNLEEQSKLGYTNLRPLQVAYESPKFMLPIRLGTVNANGPQDLLLYTLTQTGRVETTNYRTVKLPSGNEIPAYVKSEFSDFYRAMFDRQVDEHNRRAVFLEYAWNMNWCDPCAADPLSAKELRELGVFWVGEGQRSGAKAQAQPVYVTRLHVRYDADHFPEDLMLQETGDRSNFQGRYVLRHPWKGDGDCPAAVQYRENLSKRLEREAQTLASLTGWDIESIRGKIGYENLGEEKSWWETIWHN